MRLLLAVDNSTFSEAATQAVIAQSRPKETEVRVLHVIEPLAAYGGMEGGFVVDWQAVDQQQRTEAEALVTQTAKTLRDAGFQVTTARDR